ncbi:MAG: squalene/phytoene synthase family protein [Pseudomonadota bacterium]|nr:squalene/phytoene synthase family protein [Pseudomonadota bacterium]
MNHDEIYSHHLKNVSRSFAFCIERLNNPFKRWVGLGYILCRLVDTVEDSPWESEAHQTDAFESFESFILRLPEKTAVSNWAAKFSPEIIEAEKELLRESYLFFSDLNNLPENVRQSMVRTVLDMKRGMAHWAHGGQGIKLISMVQANQYCFFVAGIIGEMLSELFSFAEDSYQLTDKTLVDSYRFGFFLQKINLLKDQMGDEPQGRFLVPNREEMRQSLLVDGQGAIDYILGLPVSRKDFRIFCAWSLFLGLASLPYIDKSYKEKTLHKIPRAKTLLLLGKVELIINNNEKLKKLYNEMLIQSFSTLMTEKKTALASREDIWLYRYYQGRLTPDQMSELDLVD